MEDLKNFKSRPGIGKRILVKHFEDIDSFFSLINCNLIIKYLSVIIKLKQNIKLLTFSFNTILFLLSFMLVVVVINGWEAQ